ncbi:MAG: DUF3179 domain-containing protein [Deltaproteobacteria bacterium]|nr:DUF3179 domain-containing protein [Deltaproteobacteria bacterium]
MFFSWRFLATFTLSSSFVFSAASPSLAAPSEKPSSESLPPGVEQILPRGKIAAVFAPNFVPAAKAELSPEAWVLGVVLEGQAKAYSLNLLNRHEIVNDRIGDNPIAAVW